MKYRAFILFAVCVFTLLPLDRAHADMSVSIVNFSYSPSAITVPAGTTVVWRNNDAVQHTVTDDSGSFDSGTLMPGNQYSHLFMTPGTYTYHCNFHSNMHGTIVVTGASQQSPSQSSNPGTYSNLQSTYSQPSYTQSQYQQQNYTQPSYLYSQQNYVQPRLYYWCGTYYAYYPCYTYSYLYYYPSVFYYYDYPSFYYYSYDYDPYLWGYW